MSSKWMLEFSTTKPEMFDQINPEQWRQHVDIHEDTRIIENPDGTTTKEEGYSYNTRILTTREYDDLVNTLYTPAQEQNKDMLTNSDDNQTILMEALAEIYEKLDALTPEEE